MSARLLIAAWAVAAGALLSTVVITAERAAASRAVVATADTLSLLSRMAGRPADDRVWARFVFGRGNPVADREVWLAFDDSILSTAHPGAARLPIGALGLRPDDLRAAAAATTPLVRPSRGGALATAPIADATVVGFAAAPVSAPGAAVPALLAIVAGALCAMAVVGRGARLTRRDRALARLILLMAGGAAAWSTRQVISTLAHSHSVPPNALRMPSADGAALLVLAVTTAAAMLLRTPPRVVREGDDAGLN